MSQQRPHQHLHPYDSYDRPSANSTTATRPIITTTTTTTATNSNSRTSARPASPVNIDLTKLDSYSNIRDNLQHMLRSADPTPAGGACLTGGGGGGGGCGSRSPTSPLFDTYYSNLSRRMDTRRDALDYERSRAAAEKHRQQLDSNSNSNSGGGVNANGTGGGGGGCAIGSHRSDSVGSEVLISSIRTSLEKNYSDMQARFKEAFENILELNRIEDFHADQNYKTIRQTHSTQRRFVDRHFRACNASVFYTDAFRGWLRAQNKIDDDETGAGKGQIVWRRAKDLCADAQFAVSETLLLNGNDDDENNNSNNNSNNNNDDDDDVNSVGDDAGESASNSSSFSRSFSSSFSRSSIRRRSRRRRRRVRLTEANYKNYFYTTDLDQGALGNCWFISAATGIIQNFTLFSRVVPFDNTFDDAGYTGAFHFRFWIYGTWKDVVIDDYLPVDADNRLIFCKNRDTPNEFWCALLEKAYAKLCGSYETLEGGFTTDALIDMSGGIEEIYNLTNLRKSLLSTLTYKADEEPALDHRSFWDILVTARKKFSVIGCNIELTDLNKSEVKMSNGLVQGHAYIVTKIAELQVNQKDYRLMRLYNPWGNDVEWNGEWSDRSSVWRSIDSKTKERLELKIESDGEFWMCYEDWLSNFDNCQICNLTPDSISDISEEHWENSRVLSNIFSMWQCQMFHGSWVQGVSAGGRGQGSEALYWTNPQYTFVINEADIIKDDYCWVIVGLMQKYTRQRRVLLKSEKTEEYIQFRLYRVRNLTTLPELTGSSPSSASLSSSSSSSSFQTRSSAQIKSTDLERVNSSGAYTNKREVTSRFALKAGVYVIVPSCYDDGVEGEFLIRIFTEKPLSKKSLIAYTRRPTVKYVSEDPHSDSSSGDVNESVQIMKELEQLSFGAASVLQKFVHIASDFAKMANRTRRSGNGNGGNVFMFSSADSISECDGAEEDEAPPRRQTGGSVPSLSNRSGSGSGTGSGSGSKRNSTPQITCNPS